MSWKSLKNSYKRRGEGFMDMQMPKFENEDAERVFWADHDSTDYLDWNQAQSMVFSNWFSKQVAEKLQKQLFRLGIRQSLLFPDLDGSAQELRIHHNLADSHMAAGDFGA